MEPTSLIEAVRYFSDLTVCNAYMRKIKWPGGKPVCPRCAGDNVGEITTRSLLKCRACGKQFSYKVGTIFEDSPLGLDKWFPAVWCIANAKNGISSHELGRAIDVTQKSAWFMLHRIREAMRTGTFLKLAGTVESDETFVGGEARNMHKRTREKKVRGREAINHAEAYVRDQVHTQRAGKLLGALQTLHQGYVRPDRPVSFAAIRGRRSDAV